MSELAIIDSNTNNVISYLSNSSQTFSGDGESNPEFADANLVQKEATDSSDSQNSEEIRGIETEISTNNLALGIPVFPNHRSMLVPVDLYAEKQLLHSQFSLEWFFGSNNQRYISTRSSDTIVPEVKLSSPISEPGSYINRSSIPTATDNKKTIYAPPRAENGDLYNRDNDGDGRVESVYVKGYYRKDGTYVRSHYRAAPRR